MLEFVKRPQTCRINLAGQHIVPFFIFDSERQHLLQ